MREGDRVRGWTIPMFCSEVEGKVRWLFSAYQAAAKGGALGEFQFKTSTEIRFGELMS